MYIQQCYPSQADILWRKKVKQIQSECLAKRKHSEKNKLKFSPALQEERYLVTASNLPYRLLKHSYNMWRKFMAFYHGWLGGRKRFLCEVRCRKLLAFFLQLFNTHSLLLLTRQSFCPQKTDWQKQY